MKPTSTILLVDDELGGRTTLEGILRPDGYHLAFASTGAEALEKASSLLPDLILLDVMMPGMDGFEVCRRLRAIPHVAEIPVIMVTALDDRESCLAGLAAGADDFLSKPVDRLELRARVQTITRLNRYRRLLTERTKFERVVDHAPVGMLIVDAQRTIVLANPAIVQLLGATDADALLGQNILTIVAPEQVEGCTALLDGVFANLVEVGRTEATFVRADDGSVPVELDIGQFVWDDQAAVQIIVRDITERKQAETALRESAAELAEANTKLRRSNRALATLSGGNLALVRASSEQELLDDVCRNIVERGGYRMALVGYVEGGDTLTFRPVAHRGFDSDYLEATFQAERAQPRMQLLIGHLRKGQPLILNRLQDLPQLMDAPTPEIQKSIQLAIHLGIASSLVLPLVRQAGLIGSLHIYAAESDAFQDDELRLLSELAEDLAYGIQALRLRRAHEHAEAALRASEERLRTTMDTMLEGAQIIGFDWRYLYVNDTVAAQGRQAKEALLGQTMMQAYPGIEQTELFATLRQCMDERIATRMENEFTYPDGAIGWFDLNIQPVPEGLFILSHDITEHKRAEWALQASEQRFRALIENAPDGITLVNAEGKVVYASPSTSRILGYSPSEALSHNPAELTHPNDLPGLMGHLAELTLNPAPTVAVEYRLRHRDGSWRWLESRISNLLAEPAVQAMIFNYRDISERKWSEAEIARQIQRLQALRAIDVAITSSLDLRLTLAVLLEQVTSQLGVDAADVLLLDPHSYYLTYAAGRGFRTNAIQQTRLRVGEGCAGQAALERQLVAVPDLREAGSKFRRTSLLSGDEFVSYLAAPLIAKGEVKGVLELFHRTRLEPDPEWLNFLEALAGQAVIAVDNAHLFEDLQRSNTELMLAYDTTIEGWSRALDLRDKETEGHSQRVTELTLEIARAMRMTEVELMHIRRGALLHDIGKMGIPNNILLKPGKLTDDEWAIMRKHPEYAYALLAPIDYLGPALDIPYCHHEKWDGSGYPRGLQGESIPLAARIFAVVDVWDAMRSDRPYRAAWPVDQAREHIRSLSGTHFEPRAVEAFLNVVGGE